MSTFSEMLGRSTAQTATADTFGIMPETGSGLDVDVSGAGLSFGDATPGTMAAGKPVYSLDQIVSVLGRYNEKWAGAAPTITYQFYETTPAGLPGDITFAPLTADERALIRTAFAAWADAANLNFVEAADNGVYGTASGRISFMLNAAAPSYEWGSTVTHERGFSAGKQSIVSAEIQISPDAVAARRLFVGGYNFQAMMHEIGHSLGLPHPGDYNADGTTITYANSAVYYQDSRQYTVMSYFDATSTGANFVPPGETASYSSATLLIDDIAAIQAIYGANMSTRTGDTVYGFHSNAGPVAYDFTVTTAPVISIWDAGGNDTIDLSGSTRAAQLDLNPGIFSNVMGMVGNLSIAYGATIENAIGSTGGDTIIGNAVANAIQGLDGDDVLQGNGGNDSLDGGAGNDTAKYLGASSDYDYWYNRSTATWTVDDGRLTPTDGVDTLVSIENLAFSDRTLALSAPVTEQAFLTQAYQNILRLAPSGADVGLVSTLAANVGAGIQTEPQVLQQLALKAAATTEVALLSYEFFTGSTPTKAGLDYLVAPTGGNANNLNSAYYQTFSIENRYINFSVNLGKLGEGLTKFTADYGSLSLFDATRKAYTTIFGGAPTDAKIGAILTAGTGLAGISTRADYFAYYGGDGANGIGTKAAMVGYLLVEAVKADLGVFAKSADAYLLALSSGTHTHVDLVGAYSQPAYAYNGG